MILRTQKGESLGFKEGKGGIMWGINQEERGRGEGGGLL